VRIEIDLEALPVATGVAEVAAQLGVPAFELAAVGGEDYELCVAMAPDADPSPPAIVWVGRALEGPAGVSLAGSDPARPLAGYQHAV
jgi:thiamine monophosphate kinase